MRRMIPNHCKLAPKALALFATLVSLSACATKGDLRDVQTELRSLAQGQNAVLEALALQARMTQDSLRGTTDQLFEVRMTVNQQLARIVDEMGILREENAQNQRVMGSIRDQLEGLMRQLQVQGGGGIGMGSGVTGPAPMVSGSSVVVDLYNASLRQFNIGNLLAARSGFTDLLQQYPGDDLAPEAQYKLAEVLVQEGRSPEAIQAFERVQQLYPTSGRVPDALYHVAVLHIEAGRRDDARRYLNLVVNTYPEHPRASQAAERLRELGPP